MDHRCEGINMAYKCKIFEAVNLTHNGVVFCIGTFVYIFKSYWHK